MGGDDIEKAKKKKKKYAKIKPKYKMIEKPLRQNILKIIDKNKFDLKQEKIKQNELTKTVYSVSLKNDDNDNNFGVLEKEKEKKEDKNKNNDDDNQQNKDNDDDNSQNKDDNDIGDDIEKAKKKKK